jgi:SAM-dependent methyltransferase
VQQPPYAGLASIYDFVMRHVDYAAWVGYVHELLERLGRRPGWLVDLACGTGSAALEFQARGYQVSGVDNSDAMLQVARKKVERLGVEIDYWQRDLRRLGCLGPFDAAVCLYDSFNYLLEPADLDQALGAVWNVLRPGSLFIFDVCTERNSLRYFSDSRDEESGPGFSYQRHSFYDSGQRLQYNRFRIRFDGQEQELDETHVQRIYPLEEIDARIAASAFERLGDYADFAFDQGSPVSDRVHYALRRPERS